MKASSPCTAPSSTALQPGKEISARAEQLVMGCQKGNHECYRSKREQLNLSGSFVRNDDGNSDDNVINQ